MPRALMWLLHVVRPGSIVTLNGRDQRRVLLSHPEPEPWVLLTHPSPPLVSTPTYFQMGGEGKRGWEPPQFTVSQQRGVTDPLLGHSGGSKLDL